MGRCKRWTRNKGNLWRNIFSLNRRIICYILPTFIAIAVGKTIYQRDTYRYLIASNICQNFIIALEYIYIDIYILYVYLLYHFTNYVFWLMAFSGSN